VEEESIFASKNFEGKEQNTIKEVVVLVPCNGVDMVSFKLNEN